MGFQPVGPLGVTQQVHTGRPTQSPLIASTGPSRAPRLFSDKFSNLSYGGGGRPSRLGDPLESRYSLSIDFNRLQEHPPRPDPPTAISVITPVNNQFFFGLAVAGHRQDDVFPPLVMAVASRTNFRWGRHEECSCGVCQTNSRRASGLFIARPSIRVPRDS